MAAVASESTLVKVKMGGIGYGEYPDELETLLGSCVGVAIWDRNAKVGGLAHVVLPDSRSNFAPPGKFADTAIVEIKKKLVAMGGNSRRLTAKIAGGSTMFGTRTERDVGEMNYQAVLKHLRAEGVALTAEHIGGSQGRMIRFSLRDGSVRVMIAREQVAIL